MKHSYAFAVPSAVLTFLFLIVVGVASANPVPEVFWYDDMEGDVSEWRTEDFTASDEPHFHVDPYYAYGGDGHSWWCGSFEYDSNGGYGNSWIDLLVLPEIHLNPTAIEEVSWGAVKAAYRTESSADRDVPRARSIQPVLTYAYRHDSEIGYDYTYAQVESLGTYVNLAVYNGTAGWTELGASGLDLTGYGDPLNIRFRFVSDGAYSDEDGDYLSDGGAFHVDDIKVYDFLTGEILFFDDAESGGLCVPYTPGPAGDHWHLIDRLCPALSDPHCWWCGDDADTSLVPPNLKNGLYTPVIEVYESYVCTCHFAMHFAVPTVDNDYVSFHGTCNGADYYQMGAMWGDFEQCDGWGSTGFNRGYSLNHFCSAPFEYAGMLFVMHTTDNGCGPGAAGDAGVMLDDFWIESNLSYGPARSEPWLRERREAIRSGRVPLFTEERYDRR